MSILGDTLLSGVQKLVGSTGKTEHQASVKFPTKPDSYVKTNKNADSFVKTGTDNGTAAGTAPSSYGGGYGGGGGRGGGGGGGSSSAEDAEKIQAQINNLGDINNMALGDLNKGYESYKGNLDNTAAGRLNDMNAYAKDRLAEMGDVAAKNKAATDKRYADRLKAMDDNAQRQLNNVNQQRKANDAALKQNRFNIMRNVEWQPAQQKEQSTLMALRNRMGNSAYGSAIQDLREGMGRVDDMNDYQLIQNWRQNEDQAYANWYQADSSLVQDYNEHIAQILEELAGFKSQYDEAVSNIQFEWEDEFSNFKNQYLDEMSRYQHEYEDEISRLRHDYDEAQSKLYQQYWSGLSNIDPLLATKENIEAAKTSGKVSVKSGKVDKAQATLDAVNSMVKTLTGKKTKKKLSTDGLDEYQKAAAEIINKQIKDKSNKSKTKAISKAAVKAAKAALNDAKDTKVEYTLPQVDLSKRADLGSNADLSKRIDLTNRVDLSGRINTDYSKALKNMLKDKQLSSAVNSRTRNYIRPDRAATRLGGANGTYQKSTAANTGFSDNLAAFTRV